MKVIWTKHLADESAKKDFQSLLNNSTQVLGRLKTILEDKDKDITSIETSIESYDSASWTSKQAHLNGRRAELKEIRELLDFIK